MASQSVKNKVYDVVVIGSGISGLTCACILGKLGKKVLVLEQHRSPGRMSAHVPTKEVSNSLPGTTTLVSLTK